MPTASFQHASPGYRETKDLPTDLETKSGDWELKSVNDDGEFLIYMAAFGNVDRGGDIIDAKAFANLSEYNRSGWIGVNHDMERLPVAYPIEATQDSKGLLIRGKFHSTPDGQACRTVVKERKAAGKAVFGSIGYKVNPNGASYEGANGGQVRRLKSVSLYEASFVNLPMNPDAEVISAKSLGGINMKEK